MIGFVEGLLARGGKGATLGVPQAAHASAVNEGRDGRPTCSDSPPAHVPLDRATK